MSAIDRDRRDELAHGGLTSRSGDIVTLRDGSQWWLNGTAWARAAADTTVAVDRVRTATRS